MFGRHGGVCVCVCVCVVPNRLACICLKQSQLWFEDPDLNRKPEAWMPSTMPQSPGVLRAAPTLVLDATPTNQPNTRGPCRGL